MFYVICLLCLYLLPISYHWATNKLGHMWVNLVTEMPGKVKLFGLFGF